MARDPKLKRSQAQEKRTAETYGGRVTPMSGATWWAKNDVTTEHLQIENKRTDNRASYTLKARELEDLDKAAAMAGKVAWFQVDLNDRSYVILREGAAIELLEAWLGAQEA